LHIFSVAAAVSENTHIGHYREEITNIKENQTHSLDHTIVGVVLYMEAVSL